MLGVLKGRKLRQRAKALVELTKKDGLQPGDPKWDGTPATHCNEYAYEAAVMLGYDIGPLLNPKGIGWTGANDMYRNAIRAMVDEELKTWDYDKVQDAANRGRFILAIAFNIYGGSGHIAVIQRHIGLFSYRFGPRIVQAGAENGECWLNEIFNLTTLTPPIFIELIKR